MVICEICGTEMEQITNTHLKKHDGITVKDYKARFPYSETVSEKLHKKHSEVMIGKNKGNIRKDARKRMNTKNPMKTPSIAKKVGDKRKEQIINGTYPAMSFFNHLPTDYEKQLIKVFENLNLPLVYVGDGKKNIGGLFPDFVCEEKKIIVELDLHQSSQPMKKWRIERENVFKSHGYKIIWVTSTNEEHIKMWVTPFFESEPKWQKIKKISHVKNTGRGNVYNFECLPNNTYFVNGIGTHNCYADYFRASLYTSFFDKTSGMGLRSVDPEKVMKLMDAAIRGSSSDISPEAKRAVKLRIPQRFGIRFEDFTAMEQKQGVSLRLMKYFKDIDYPYMINTKSNILSTDPYLKCLGDNTAVHVTLITLNEKIAKDIEPGAPTVEERLRSIEKLAEVTTVVPRIEPYMVGINSDPADLEEYAGLLHDMGINRTTWDTYSYSANNATIAKNFESVGYNWERMFEMTTEYQPLGSILMEGAMSIFRNEGIMCNTFDFGCVPQNEMNVCCSVDDVRGFENYHRYNILSASRFIISRGRMPTTFRDFQRWAGNSWLSEQIKADVAELWKSQNDDPWSVDYVQGIRMIGCDSNGMPIFNFVKDDDYRMKVKMRLLEMKL